MKAKLLHCDSLGQTTAAPRPDESFAISGLEILFPPISVVFIKRCLVIDELQRPALTGRRNFSADMLSETPFQIVSAAGVKITIRPSLRFGHRGNLSPAAPPPSCLLAGEVEITLRSVELGPWHVEVKLFHMLLHSDSPGPLRHFAFCTLHSSFFTPPSAFSSPGLTRPLQAAAGLGSSLTRETPESSSTRAAISAFACRSNSISDALSGLGVS